MEPHILAIDLGGTNTKMGLLTHDMRLVQEAIVPTNAKLGAEAAVDLWMQTIRAWLKNFKIDLVGMGSPGPLDCEKGMMLASPNLKGWVGFSFTDYFRKNLGVPAYIENDANCAALGEWHFHKVNDLVMLTLGTGVGSGVVSGGKLIRGVKGLGVEAGHMVINFKSGPPCGCGRHGCLEAYVGARQLSNRYNAKSDDKVPELDAYEIFLRAEKGDKVAAELVDEWIQALAVGIGNLVDIFNPSVVALTGGVSRAFPKVESRFTKILLTEAFEASLKCTKVVVSQLQEKAGIFGAALWAQQQA